jgi:hypothetical protein
MLFIWIAEIKKLFAYNIVTDLLKALLDNGSVNTFQHTCGQQ